MSADNYGTITVSGTRFELRSHSASADEDPGSVVFASESLKAVLEEAENGFYFEYGYSVSADALSSPLLVDACDLCGTRDALPGNEAGFRLCQEDTELLQKRRGAKGDSGRGVAGKSIFLTEKEIDVLRGAISFADTHLYKTSSRGAEELSEVEFALSDKLHY